MIPISRRTAVVLRFCALLLVFPALFATAQAPTSTTKRLLGYYPEWSKYNTPPYTAAQIPYSKLTHISHAFVLLAYKADGTLQVPSGMIEPALISKAHAAGVKVLVSIVTSPESWTLVYGCAPPA